MNETTSEGIRMVIRDRDSTDYGDDQALLAAGASSLIGKQVFRSDISSSGTFCVVDFETMTAERTSVCSVGMVRVENGVLSRSWESLIRPIPDGRTRTNEQYNRITREMVAHAPTFSDVWPMMQSMLDGAVVVCHNHSMDMHCLERCCRYYGIKIAPYRFFDTYSHTREALINCCARCGIDVSNHHDASADATMTARLLLEILNDRYEPSAPGYIPRHSNERLAGEALSVPGSECGCLSGKTVIISGVFRFMSREELALTLRRKGARVTSSISSRTDFLIAGADAGPVKLEKAQKIIENQGKIRIINENGIKEMLNGK